MYLSTKIVAKCEQNVVCNSKNSEVCLRRTMSSTVAPELVDDVDATYWWFGNIFFVFGIIIGIPWKNKEKNKRKNERKKEIKKGKEWSV